MERVVCSPQSLDSYMLQMNYYMLPCHLMMKHWNNAYYKQPLKESCSCVHSKGLQCNLQDPSVIYTTVPNWCKSHCCKCVMLQELHFKCVFFTAFICWGRGSGDFTRIRFCCQILFLHKCNKKEGSTLRESIMVAEEQSCKALLWHSHNVVTHPHMTFM